MGVGGTGCRGKKRDTKELEIKPGALSEGSLPAALLPSLYQSRVRRLASEAVQSPPPEPLETTLRRVIAVCYQVQPDWAPHVRVTAWADNPAEHQMNAPVYDTLLVVWGEPGFEDKEVRCTPVMGTDVMSGRVKVSSFWSRMLPVEGKQLPFRALIHQLLYWFVCLEDGDTRKQLLVNMLLQLHEAAYNCIGRHKEVFEYCVYDLADAEAEGAAAAETHAEAAKVDIPSSHPSLPLENARKAVCRFACQYVDWHKRAALHSAFLSPLKFLFQDQYEVFENLDSHGASFWVAVLTESFFPGLEMPFEAIIDLDLGWSWGARHFLPCLESGSAHNQKALAVISEPENLGADWRRLTAGLRPSGREPGRLPGMPFQFQRALRAAAQPGNALRRALEPYAFRFTDFMALSLMLRKGALRASLSERWDAELGPALARLTEEALGFPLEIGKLRERLCMGGDDGGPDQAAFHALLRTAGVAWAL